MNCKSLCVTVNTSESPRNEPRIGRDCPPLRAFRSEIVTRSASGFETPAMMVPDLSKISIASVGTARRSGELVAEVRIVFPDDASVGRAEKLSCTRRLGLRFVGVSEELCLLRAVEKGLSERVSKPFRSVLRPIVRPIFWVPCAELPSGEVPCGDLLIGELLPVDLLSGRLVSGRRALALLPSLTMGTTGGSPSADGFVPLPLDVEPRVRNPLLSFC